MGENFLWICTEDHRRTSAELLAHDEHPNQQSVSLRYLYCLRHIEQQQQHYCKSSIHKIHFLLHGVRVVLKG